MESGLRDGIVRIVHGLDEQDAYQMAPIAVSFFFAYCF
jgi:hypothetical protein